MNKILIKAVILFINIYKYFFSQLLGNTCRFLPSCSDYCIECLKEHGFFKGVFLGFKIILKCHNIRNSNELSLDF
jgi:putative membrane protein insertion efficiency factor